MKSNWKVKTCTKVLQATRYKEIKGNHEFSVKHKNHKGHKYFKINNKSSYVTKPITSSVKKCGRKGHIKQDCYYLKKTNECRKDNRKMQTVQYAQPSTEPTGFAFMTGDYKCNSENS